MAMDSQPDALVVSQPIKRKLEDDNTSKQAKQQKIEDELCDRCKNIEWSKLANEAPLSLSGMVLATLSISQEQLRQSRCPVCRLLASIKPSDLDSEVCKLKAFSSRLSFLYESRPTRKEGRLPPTGAVPECTVLYFIPKNEGSSASGSRTGWHKTGCLGLINTARGAKPRCGPREILPWTIDYTVIKQWMSLCRYKHSKTCAPLRKPGLRGLRVIDCRTRTVIEPPASCQYVAVSYVWGQRSQDASKSSRFAPVIEDSISVALSLGFRYLWVDRYCIDQNNPNKQDQIDCMDQIYSRAELTLVAAAGADARYGLPGVGQRMRKPQENINIGPLKLARIPPHTSCTLRFSVWASRGWTYQEGILSRRRLIFTDDQVSYLCNEMHCIETANMRPEPVNKKERNTPFTGFLPRTVNSNTGYEEWGEYRDIKGHIMEFSKRQLSYDSDALNAILGIFCSLRSSKGRLLQHLYGLPVKLSISSSTVIVPLHWYHDSVARRRENFPSWSWTGWDGAVRMTDPDIQAPNDCEIGVQSGERGSVPLFQFMDLRRSVENAALFDPLRVLSITARMISVTLRWKTWGKLNDSFSQETQKGSVKFLDGFHAVLPMTEKFLAWVYAYLDREILHSSEVVGLILGKPTSKTGVGILLLEAHGEWYQRVGILRYREGRGSEAGGNHIPQIVYADAEDNILDEIKYTESFPLWLQEAEVRTIGIV